MNLNNLRPPYSLSTIGGLSVIGASVASVLLEQATPRQAVAACIGGLIAVLARQAVGGPVTVSGGGPTTIEANTANVTTAPGAKTTVQAVAWLLMTVGAAMAANVGPVPYSALGQPGGPPVLDARGNLFVDGGISTTSVYSAIYPGVTFRDRSSVSFVMPADAVEVQRSGSAVYYRNQAAATGGNINAVGFFTAGSCEANGSACWGVNTLLQDAATRVVGSGTGRVLVNELDFNVMNPGTQVIGLSLGGNSLVQPGISNAFVVNPLGSGIKWGGGLLTIDGAAVYGTSIGLSAAAGLDVPSQLSTWAYRDHLGNKQQVTLQAVSSGGGTGGFLSMTSSGGADFALNGRTLYAGGVNAGSSTLSGSIYATGLPTCASAPPSGSICRDATVTPNVLKLIP